MNIVKSDNSRESRVMSKYSKGAIMAGTHFPTNCPRCGNVAEAWTEDGVTVKVRCKMCGYEGVQPHPDLKNGAWRVG